MPELPDVEGWRRFLAAKAEDARIERLTVPEPDVLRNTTPQGLGRAVTGERFVAPERHGKWLFAPVESGTTVVLHFGMTGRLSWHPAEDGTVPLDAHDHVVFVCDHGELRVNMPRKFGGVWLAADERERRAITGPLGPDATSVDREQLGRSLDGRRGSLKSALTDQELIAGLGNLLADEILWEARLYPRASPTDLTEEDLDALHDALQTALERSIPTGRVPPEEGTITRARDEEEPRCPRCGTALERIEVSSRSTYFCPECQLR